MLLGGMTGDINELFVNGPEKEKGFKESTHETDQTADVHLVHDYLLCTPAMFESGVSARAPLVQEVLPEMPMPEPWRIVQQGDPLVELLDIPSESFSDIQLMKIVDFS